MIDDSNLLSTNNQKNQISLIPKKDTHIMRIQHNLIMMGFDITMVNKIISNFKISNEQGAIDYLIKSENGMWNHPFIPKEEDPEDKMNMIEQPKVLMNNVFSKINNIKKTATLSGKSSVEIENDNINDDIINTNNNKNNIINNNNVNKIINEDICDICGEGKEFHIIKEFHLHNNNIIEDEDKIDIINEENSNLLNNDINTNINIIKNEEENEEEKVEEKEEEEENNNMCQICMDEFENPIEIENCKHKFCLDCFHSYLVDKITNNQIDSIPCPKKKCKIKNLSENYFSNFLTEQEYFKYRQFKAQNEIAKDSKKVFCPLCDSYADIEEGQVELFDSNNPNYIKTTLKCQKGHEFCSCGRALHEGDCYHDEKEFKDFLVTEQIKKCPKCGFLIKKNKGCNHMTCGNPTCKYEFCWLCLQEAVPDHFKFGPCAGKQFFDPDSFSYQLKLNHPCLYILYNFGIALLIFVVISVTFIAVPGIGLGMISFGIICIEDTFDKYGNTVKTFIFLGYFCLGFAMQTVIYMCWGLVFVTLGLIIAVVIIDLVFEILKCILNCICCGAFDDNRGQNNNILGNIQDLRDNINANNN